MPLLSAFTLVSSSVTDGEEGTSPILPPNSIASTSSSENVVTPPPSTKAGAGTPESASSSSTSSSSTAVASPPSSHSAATAPVPPAPLRKPPPKMTSQASHPKLQRSASLQASPIRPDITSREGTQEAASGSSALSNYLKRMGDIQRAAVDRFYDVTVERSCLLTCDTTTELLTCGQNFKFLPFPRDRGDDCLRSADSNTYPYDETPPMPTSAGAYAVPTSCEYCGSISTKCCSQFRCQRPKLFFRRKRPVFCPPDANFWDSESDYDLTYLPPLPPHLTTSPPPPLLDASQREGSGASSPSTATNQYANWDQSSWGALSPIMLTLSR